MADPLAITCNPTVARLGQAYSYTPTPSGGVPPYYWNIDAIYLAFGLTFDFVTGEISGTPDMPGTYPIRLYLDDDVGSPTAETICRIVVLPVGVGEDDVTCTINILGPGGGNVGTGQGEVPPPSGEFTGETRNPDRPLKQIPICSVFDMDRFKPGWQNDRGCPQLSFMGGRNMLGFWPVPDQDYDAAVDICRNMVTPTHEGAFLQVGKEWLETIIDFAQHLAQSKNAGEEFYQSIALYDNMIRLAKVMNERLSAVAFYEPTVEEHDQREMDQVHRVEPEPNVNKSTKS